MQGGVKMKRETHEVEKKTLDEITEFLKDETLTEEERQEMEKHAARLAGVILSPWIPFGWSRRLIMAGIVALALYGLTVGGQVLIWLALLPFFSPRIMGEASFFLGKLFGKAPR